MQSAEMSASKMNCVASSVPGSSPTGRHFPPRYLFAGLQSASVPNRLVHRVALFCVVTSG